MLRFDSFSKVLSAGIRIGFASGPDVILGAIERHVSPFTLVLGLVPFFWVCFDILCFWLAGWVDGSVNLRLMGVVQDFLILMGRDQEKKLSFSSLLFSSFLSDLGNGFFDFGVLGRCMY